ncbi:hypothetical protein [Desulfosporosinus hippei]|uniref:hypothetical protein n=1 Tax=Desulfosporosinus hippei TaxID=569859 RepID=UPI0015A40ADC|nr:hypothetical protein [Desulfosporosinus hippei]
MWRKAPLRHEAFLWGGWHSSFAAKHSLGDLRLRRNSPPETFVTGHYRAFRSRADDTWGIAPGKVGSTLQEYAL